jgi:hypothetical protein
MGGSVVSTRHHRQLPLIAGLAFCSTLKLPHHDEISWWLKFDGRLLGLNRAIGLVANRSSQTGKRCSRERNKANGRVAYECAD